MHKCCGRDLVRHHVVASVTSLALLLSLIPVPSAAFAEEAPAPTPTTAQIVAMTEEQECVYGEAIVVAEAGADLSVGHCEQLAKVGDGALDLTAVAAEASEDEVLPISAQRAKLSDATEYVVYLVTSDSMSTEELIAELYNNPQVISAEPNYVKEPDEDPIETGASAVTESQLEAQDGDEGAPERGKAGENHQEVGDLSSLQWALSNKGTYHTPEGDAVAGIDMAVPGWEGNGVGSPNSSASSTIAVLDSGVDVTHPDLSKVLYTFTDEQQASYGCGEHGFNAATTDPSQVGDLTDPIGHGTHVAGIMAAAWDGMGTAGIANGSKLLCVRLSKDDGAQSADGAMRAFGFLIKCARDVNLKAINCSWGSEGHSEFVYTLLINQLGAEGVVTVFAAGNSALDLSQNINTAGFIDSPYVLVVDALNPAGSKVGFSDYGQTITDVFAPGSSILSTVPDYVRKPNEPQFDESYQLYLPQSGDGTSVKYSFTEGDMGGVQFLKTNPLEGEAQTVGSLTSSIGVDDHSSYNLPYGEFGPGIPWSEHTAHNTQGTIFVAIPVGDIAASDISYVSARMALTNTPANSYLTLFGVVATTDGGTKIVDLRNDKTDFYNASTSRVGSYCWSTATLNVKRLLQTDPEARSVYLDEHGRMIVELTYTASESEDIKSVNIDDIAVGGAGTRAGAYEIFNGTSMAAPAVTGALAVVAKDEPSNSSLEGDELALLALKRSARLRAATIRTDELQDLCATGGYVNLAAYQTLESTEDGPLAPTIASTSTAGNANASTLQVDGHFFGSDQGTVLVDGVALDVVAWQDTAIVAQLPEGFQNGAHVVSVQTQSGTDKQAFSFSQDETGTHLYERDLAIPDLGSVAGDAGVGSLCANLVGSGDSLYVICTDMDHQSMCLWRYNIEHDVWTSCAPMPTNSELYGHALAPTEKGLVLYVAAMDSENRMITEMYDYDAANDAWSKRELPCKIPYGADIYTKGEDLYFIGGNLEDWDKPEDTLFLSVLHPGEDKLEILGYGACEKAALFDRGACAWVGNYIYLMRREPFDGMWTAPNAMLRLKLDESDKVVEVVDLTDALVESGVSTRDQVATTVIPSAGDGGAYTVGTFGGMTDTFFIANDETSFVPQDFTSSFYKASDLMATTYKGVLYVIGNNPSEPHLMYFRSQRVYGDVMYRLYNPNSGEHFFTADAAERDAVVAAGWNYEGEAWAAPSTSETPVYRLYNSHEPLGDHHYTTDKAEYDHLVSVGWTGEGIAWYSDDAQGMGLYRLYNPNAYPLGKTGAHHYTTNADEKDQLVSLGWQYEGIGWYGL